MKGAMEFSRFDILNPYSSDSYIPIIQVTNGLLNKVFSCNLLREQWIFPLLAAGFHLLVLYVVISTLVEGLVAQWLALAFGAILLVGLNLTNGGIARAGSLLLLSMLVLYVRDSRDWKKTILVLLAVSGAFFIGRKLAKSEAGFLILILCLLPLGAKLSARFSRRVVLVVAAVTLTVFLVPVHRSGLVFIPAVLGCIFCFMLVKHAPFLHSTRQKLISLVTVVPLFALAATALGGCIVAAALREGTTIGLFGLEGLYNLLLKTLLGLSLGGEAKLGAGPKLAALELGRSATPLLVLLLFVGAVLYWVIHVKLLIQSPNGYNDTKAAEKIDIKMIDRMIWLWPTMSVLCIIILLGIPFAYRVGFLPILFAIIILVDMLHYFYVHSTMGRSRAILIAFLGVVVTYSILAALVLYGFRFSAAAVEHDYLRWFHPVRVILLATIVGIGLLAIWLRGRDGLAILLVTSCVLTALFLDKHSMRVKFMDFSFGKEVPSDVAAITHYNIWELDAAKRLLSVPQTTALLADPFTMSIMRAMTGLSGVLDYSNISTVNPMTKSLIQQVLRISTDTKLTSEVRRQQYNTALDKVLNVGSSELNYTFLNQNQKKNTETFSLFSRRLSLRKKLEALRSGTTSSVSTFGGQGWADEAFSGSGSLWKVVAVVTEKTVAWASLPAGENLGYYPMSGKLRPEIVAGIEESFNVLFNIDNRIIAFELDPSSDAKVSTR
jgi:hypothetical protein